MGGDRLESSTCPELGCVKTSNLSPGLRWKLKCSLGGERKRQIIREVLNKHRKCKFS